jgi:hypothetical protein
MADVGSLSIDATSVVQGAPIVFTYSVSADHASDTNWIGLGGRRWWCSRRR